MQGKESMNTGDDPSVDIEQVQSNPSLVEDCKLNRIAEPRYEPEIDNMGASPDVFEDFQPVIFYFLRREQWPRRWFIKLVTWPFERLSILVILINCVTLGLYDPFDPECLTQECQVLDVMEKVIYAFFLAEMLCKWMAMGLFGKLAYFGETWNRLDCFIVAAGTFELLYNEGEYLSAVRAIRVLRPLRAIHRVPSIRILVTLLLDTLPMLWNVLAICFFIFAIFGIVGVQLWNGRLRGRCFLDLPVNASAESFNLTEFYIPPDETDFVCSMPDVPGMKLCGSIPPYQSEARVCTLDYASYLVETQKSNNSNACVDWNQYYKVCKQEGDNPFWGAIGFDNIFIAWVAIFQVITLEGWSDIMYYVQDAHGVWNFIYFVILIVIASYFMTNLCLVVITTQFQETKHRENELLRESRRRQGTSTSTISSSRYGKDGCWAEILKYIEHLIRRFKRRMHSRFNWKYCEGKNKRTRTSKHKNRRRKKKKHVYHHHHHHHHHHHYHHHVHCTDPGCPCGQASQLFPGSLNVTPNASSSDFRRLQAKQDKPDKQGVTGNTLTVPGQVSGQSQAKQDNGGRSTAIPTISIVTGSSCSVRKEPLVPGEMITTATAAVAINGKSAVADIAAHTFLSAASLSSAAATATASSAAAAAIHNACSCAMEHVEEDVKVDYESECVYEDGDESESELSNDDMEGKVQGKRKLVARLRHACHLSVESKWFMYVIMGAIFLNTLSMGIEYHGQPQKMTDVLETSNYIFTAIFALEMLLKLIGLGPYGYIKDMFNLFDGSIVIMSIVELFDDGGSGISVLRSFRLLRIFKLVRFLPALRRQLMVMIHTMDNVVTFLALLALFIFTASILGMNLFGGKYDTSARANFDDLFWALVTVFQVLTQEDWNTVMYDGMRATSKWAALYFILLMTIGNYILFNLLVAILVEGFANQPEKSESAWSVKSKQHEPDCPGRMELVRCPQHPYPMIPPMVCVSRHSPGVHLARTGSHDDLIRDGYKDTADQEQYRRSSLPSALTPKSVFFRDECHASAPTSSSTSPRVTHKTLSFGDKTTMVIVNPVHAERCITSEDENEMSAKEEDEEHVMVQNASSCFGRRRDWSLYIFSPSNKFREGMTALYSNKWFDRVVLFFILFNCVIMALERPDLPKDSTMKKVIDICMYIFLGIFTIEMMIKVIALGFWVGPKAYLRSGWNVMDGFLVIISWIDVIVSLTTDTESSILGVLRVFRALRTLRPLRVISRAPGLKIVVETLISSLKPIGNIVLIAATFFIIFGILGVQLFKGKFFYCKDKEFPSVKSRQDCLDQSSTWENKEYNFDNLAKALLTLFVFSTKDGWVTIMYDGLDAVDIDKQPIINHQKWNVLYFVAFLLLAGFVVLNMLVGVVVENFQKCRDLMEKDRLAEKERERARRLQCAAEEEEAGEFAQPRRFVHKICTHGYFDLGIAAVIVLNVICMGMEHYNQPEAMSEFLRWANYMFTGIFIIEGALKIYALSFKKYIRERWNQLDLLIILLSIVGVVLEEMNSELPINPTIIRVMRVLRIARVLKLLKTAEGIRKLLDTVAEALPQVGNLGLLFLLMFFIFAALGMELFGEIDCTDSIPCEGLGEHAHFKNFGFAMLTLFRVSTGDNWNGILKDIINSKRCEENPTQGCSALEHIAPIYFAIFVLATQFVLLNVVVAVLMKHLEEAKEDDALSSREATDTVFAIQSEPLDDDDDDEEATKRTQLSVDGPRSESNSNTMVVVPILGYSSRKTDSESSMSSIEQAVRTYGGSRVLSRHDLMQRLPPVEPSIRSPSLATLRLPPIGSQPHGLNKGKIDDSSLSELSSPENEQAVKNMRDGPLSPRAPIYVMSEDSDLNDNKMDDEHDPGRLFRPVHGGAKSKDLVYSASSLSSSEDEGKGKQSSSRKPHYKPDSRKAKLSKKDPKATASVSPVKQVTKPVKPGTRWASPVSRAEKEMNLRDMKPSNDDDKGKSYETQSYV